MPRLVYRQDGTKKTSSRTCSRLQVCLEQAGSSLDTVLCSRETVTELVSQNLTEICQWEWSGVAPVAVATSLPCRFNVFALCVNPWRVDT